MLIKAHRINYSCNQLLWFTSLWIAIESYVLSVMEKNSIPNAYNNVLSLILI